MLCCSEMPVCMLGYDVEVNDYDFVLYHQFIKNSTYRETYLNRRTTDPNRLMILDNSAYEFFVSGESFNVDDYVRVVNELRPDIYIVPDSLMNTEETLKRSAAWLENYLIKITAKTPSGSSPIPMMTPQGRTRAEFNQCLQYMATWIEQLKLPKFLCIPFHDEFLKIGAIPTGIVDAIYSNGEEITVDRKYAIGRVLLMNELCMILPDYKFHLLGSHDPAEIRSHRGHPQIMSIDSGYPVKCGIAGVVMGEETEKPNISIDDFCDKELNDKTKELILSNIKKMKDYAK